MRTFRLPTIEVDANRCSIRYIDASIMSQPILWVIHTNKCGSIQLLGQYNIVPYEIYHLINCIHYPLYSYLISCLLCIETRFFNFWCTIQQNGYFLAYLTALSLCSHPCHTSRMAAMDIPCVNKASWCLFLCQ